MIEINPSVQEKINAHAEATFPYECCGFLYGSDGENGQRVITDYIESPNSHQENQRRRFQIVPSDYLKAERYADENNLSLLGIYHSHPDHPAIPSEHDRIQAMPFFSYVIISVMSGKTADVRSYVLNPEFQFDEENFINSSVSNK
jgi:proteasome lid subunit RPN8/RPN11